MDPTPEGLVSPHQLPLGLWKSRTRPPLKIGSSHFLPFKTSKNKDQAALQLSIFHHLPHLVSSSMPWPQHHPRTRSILAVADFQHQIFVEGAGHVELCAHSGGGGLGAQLSVVGDVQSTTSGYLGKDWGAHEI